MYASAEMLVKKSLADGFLLDWKSVGEKFKEAAQRNLAVLVSGGHTAVSALGTYDALSKLAGGTGTTLAADLVEK